MTDIETWCEANLALPSADDKPLELQPYQRAFLEDMLRQGSGGGVRAFWNKFAKDVRARPKPAFDGNPHADLYR